MTTQPPSSSSLPSSSITIDKKDPPSSTLPTSITSDPLLSAFLSPSFSPTTYLNNTLPQLSINTLNTTITSTTSTPPPSISISNNDDIPLSLATVHSKANTLLSTLDVNLNRSQASLTTITDDILRTTPRLGYEVEVLRSDVLGLAETLSSPTTQRLIEGLIDHDDQDSMVNGQSLDQVRDKNKDETEKRSKPKVLKKLETLVKVKNHLEDVIKIFGEAMEWTLPDDTTSSTTDSGYAITTISTNMTNRSITSTPSSQNQNKGSKKIEQDVTFMIDNNEIQKATERVEELAKLCTVWENTSEFQIRKKFVEALRWKIISSSGGGAQGEIYNETDNTKESEDVNGVSGSGDGGVSSGLGGYGIALPGVTDAGREGYYGLINQFQRMRGWDNL